MKTILKTNDLHKVYRLGGFLNRARVNALDRVNLHVRSDEPVIISLVGESGSGKTTLAKFMLRLIEPSGGQAIVYDQNRRRQRRQQRQEVIPVHRTAHIPKSV